MESDEGLLVVIVGPTASGKSALAISLCDQGRRGEVINADAMQMYEGCPIATNKPSLEEQNGVPHHLLGVVDPFSDELTVHRFVEECEKKIREIWSRGRVAVVVGGTFYYVWSLLFGELIVAEGNTEKEEDQEEVKLDQMNLEEKVNLLHQVDAESAQRIDPRDGRKIDRALQIFFSSGKSKSEWGKEQKKSPQYANVRVVYVEGGGKDELERKIDARVDEMMERGLVEEARNFCQMWREKKSEEWPPNVQRGIWQSIGLKEFVLLGEESVQNCVLRVKEKTKQYSRRQRRTLRCTLLPRVDHVVVKKKCNTVDVLWRWIETGEEEKEGEEEGLEWNARESQEDREESARKKTERLDCVYCKKTIMGADQIGAHVKSRPHRRRKAKAKEKEKKVSGLE